MPVRPIFVNIFSKKVPFAEKYYFLLRLGVLGCFVGHGFWGLTQKTGWLPFYDVFFIPHDIAFFTMTIVGAVDIAIGLLGFLYPTFAVLVWATVWTLFTAMLRPAANMGVSEFFERGGNYGVPIAFLALYLWQSKIPRWKDLLDEPKFISEENLKRQYFILKLSLGFLLMGHGGFGLFLKKEMLISHFASVGIHMGTAGLQGLGLFEILLGMAIIVRPTISLLGFILIWKIFSESLYVTSGRWIDIFETIERFGDYVIPIMLILVIKQLRNANFLKIKKDISQIKRPKLSEDLNPYSKESFLRAD